jgi:hypothetical protein
MQDPASELLRIPLFPRRWVNRRYDARSVDDPRYTDTVREDFDRIADLSEAERVGPEGTGIDAFLIEWLDKLHRLVEYGLSHCSPSLRR